MHDLLYEQPGRARRPAPRELRRRSSASTCDRFVDDLATHVTSPRPRGLLGGVLSGVNGTPTFFINGVRHDGPFDFDSLLAAMTLAARFPRAG